MTFCDECGAANYDTATTCVACQSPLKTALPAPIIHTSVSVNANTRQQQVMLQVSSQVPLLPGAQVNHYKIQEQIGEGGFGIVYRAKDIWPPTREVALKQIPLARLSPREMIQATDSYNRETTLQPWLKHKGVPRVYEHFTDAENWYLVMDYIEGETLEETLKHLPAGKLSLRETLEIGAQLCEVLNYLHRQEVIFRDVKPANIMRTVRGRVYLIDFGIARRYDRRKAKDTTPLGSPGYAAPEQYGTAQSSPRTDIYGLGATLLTLATGKDLADCTLSEALAEADLPPQLTSLLGAMLAQQPEQRPETMRLVQRRLWRIHSRLPGQWLRNTLTFALFLLWGGIFPLCYLLLTFIYSRELVSSIANHTSYIGSGALSVALPCLTVFQPLVALVLLLIGANMLRRPSKMWRGLGLMLGVLLSLFLVLLFQAWRLVW